MLTLTVRQGSVRQHRLALKEHVLKAKALAGVETTLAEKKSNPPLHLHLYNCKFCVAGDFE